MGLDATTSGIWVSFNYKTSASGPREKDQYFPKLLDYSIGVSK